MRDAGDAHALVRPQSTGGSIERSPTGCVNARHASNDKIQGSINEVAEPWGTSGRGICPVNFSFHRRRKRPLHGGRFRVWTGGFDSGLRRHIQLDGEEHGALALELVSSLCGHDHQRTAEALQAAERALEARIAVWDGVLKAIKAGDRQK
ncbi:MAG: DUF3050 domain-containing protein, partial [Candidatus Limnocylindrales bacterium]